MHTYLSITGGRTLNGTIAIGGAKNAALPAMAAAILGQEALELDRIPEVADITTMGELLVDLGLRVETSAHKRRILPCQHPYLSVSPACSRRMRASILALGPLLSRYGRARLGLPGGCALGGRPIDIHLRGLAAMGADIRVVNGTVWAEADYLKGTDFTCDTTTVTGTENLMMAATLARGTTILRGAAQEPEIIDLAELLVAMGADIEGHGSSTIVIRGRRELGGAHHQIMPDRIEAGTYLCAAAMTGGQVRVTGLEPEHLRGFLGRLQATGLPMQIGATYVTVGPHDGLNACHLTTEPFPGFPTDLQPPFLTLMTQAEGQSVIQETIFENRLMHVPELRRMGARIDVQGTTARVTGPVLLHGTKVTGRDLRATAALVVAALAARGETRLHGLSYLDRGYADLTAKLSSLGAEIRRVHRAKSPQVQARNPQPHSSPAVLELPVGHIP